MTLKFTMGTQCYSCEEKGWYTEIRCRLQRAEQGNSKGLISNA